ncbi:MAG: glutamine--tRNA ligase/YqeY domain fusion protein [bacterium]|nr:glutamine--tRNA ligase/YqeY domain fusion protein [bacterium]
MDPPRPTDPADEKPGDAPPSDFIRAIVTDDIASGKWGGRVATRFPPEPNGYLHIGHATSIWLNFGVAEQFGGTCNLRFDDTNPTTEDMEYVEAIQRDIRWLGYDWADRKFHASDYFEELYQHAVHLIRTGKAYVDDLNEVEIREYRGTIKEPGRPSLYRDRSVEENLELFARMKAGEFEDGRRVLRAKIDLAANNMLMRDPVLYRIICRAHHYRTGDQWHMYPMYDFTHCLSDSIEDITHSLCTLEFENNRELYDWVLDNTPVDHHPQQIEFARRNLSYTVMSKRKLLVLVQEGHVSGWDDPRMPTISGLRHRGYTPGSIRNFCDRAGIAKTQNVTDLAQLEFSIRDDLNQRVPRVLAVLRPLKVVIENYPEEQREELEAPYYPHDVPKEGSRRLPFSREILIERDDFHEDPPKGFFRMAPGREVRLRYAYIIRCERVIRDEATDEVTELRCSYDPATRGGDAPDGRKVKGTIHWVCAEHSLPLEVRLYDRLFTHEDPAGQEADFRTFLNPASLEILTASRIEPSVAEAAAGDRFQFERQGYFVVDQDSAEGALVVNRTVTLRDTWAKISGDGHSARRSAAAAEKAAEKAAVKERQRRQSLAAAAPAELDDLTPEVQAELERYRDTLGLPEQDARLLATDADLGRLFAEAIEVCAHPQTVANWIVNELRRELKGRPPGDLPFAGRQLGELVSLIITDTISGKIAKGVFADMLATGEDPATIVARKGLEQVTDAGELGTLVDRVLDENSDKVEEYRAGKTALLGFFVGQVMRASRGKANPGLANNLLKSRLDGDGAETSV